MSPGLVRKVWRRAQDRCEYCRISSGAYPLPFHIDHIIARQHGGLTELGNLALACLHCNRHKGPNIAGRDPDSHEIARLFHPRRDEWKEHFKWRGPWLEGITPIGRTTVLVLAINAPEFLAVREALIDEEVFRGDGPKPAE